jgi:hypothetical protein
MSLPKRPANQQVHGASPATFREKHRCLTGGVPCSHDGDILIVIERGFHAGACVMDAGRLKSLRTFDIELPPAHACCCQNRASAKLRTAIEVQRMETIRTFCGIDSVNNDRGHHPRAELEHLKHSARGEFVSRKTVWKTDEVLDSGRCARLPTGAEAIQHNVETPSDAA